MQDGTNFSGTKGSNFDAMTRGEQNRSLYDLKKTHKKTCIHCTREVC